MTSNDLFEGPVALLDAERGDIEHATPGSRGRVRCLVVPVDGSDRSCRAIGTAVALGRRWNAPIDILGVAISAAEARVVRNSLTELLSSTSTSTTVWSNTDRTGRAEVPLSAVVRVREFVAAEIAEYARARPGSLIVMSSQGRGRGAAFGSVAGDVLMRTPGGVLMVGPNVPEGKQLDGPVVVTVDGSDDSEIALPLAARWGHLLGSDVWIVEVSESQLPPSADITETGHSEALAQRLALGTGVDVQFEALHGNDVPAAVSDFADAVDASVVVAATHGRSGLARLVIGSTAAGFVRTCRSPVLLQRPVRHGLWPAHRA